MSVEDAIRSLEVGGYFLHSADSAGVIDSIPEASTCSLHDSAENPAAKGGRNELSHPAVVVML